MKKHTTLLDGPWTFVVDRTCLLQSLRLRLRNPRVHEDLAAVGLGMLLPLKVIPEDHSKVFGAVCDL